MKLIRAHSLPSSCNSTPSYRNCILQLHTSFSGVGAVLQFGNIYVTEELLGTTCQEVGQHALIPATRDP